MLLLNSSTLPFYWTEPSHSLLPHIVILILQCSITSLQTTAVSKNFWFLEQICTCKLYLTSSYTIISIFFSLEIKPSEHSCLWNYMQIALDIRLGHQSTTVVAVEIWHLIILNSIPLLCQERQLQNFMQVPQAESLVLKNKFWWSSQVLR